MPGAILASLQAVRLRQKRIQPWLPAYRGGIVVAPPGLLGGLPRLLALPLCRRLLLAKRGFCMAGADSLRSRSAKQVNLLQEDLHSGKATALTSNQPC